MKRLLKEPLLHFIIAGALIFAAHYWTRPAIPDAGVSPRQVRIGAGEVKWLTETWVRQWHRAPTPDELRALVTSLLKEELLAREARELRLDENDTIVRRRLAQKLEFVLKDTERLAEPPEGELRQLYETHAADYAAQPRVSFSQVYFNRERRKDAAADAVKALANLASAARGDTAEIGDRMLLEPEFGDADPNAIASAFGADFARAVFALPAGGWHGPIESAYGLHLVRVDRIAPARPREFAEVKPQLVERWRTQRQRESEQRYLDRLMAKYEVVIEESVRSTIGPLTLTQATEAAR